MTTTASDSKEPAKELPRPVKVVAPPKHAPLPLSSGGGDAGFEVPFADRKRW